MLKTGFKTTFSKFRSAKKIIMTELSTGLRQLAMIGSV
jgi:hypothetical protein